MMKLDHERKVTEVFGRQPLRFMQDGRGFNAAGDFLGPVNDQGELIEDLEKGPDPEHQGFQPDSQPPEQAPDQTPEQPPEQPAEQKPEEPASQQNPEEPSDQGEESENTQGPDLDELIAQYSEKTLKDLRAMGGKAGIKGASALNKPALAEELAKRDVAEGSAA